MRGILVMMCLFAAWAEASVTVFARNQAGFNAAAPDAVITVDFDSLPSGTNVSGQAHGGILFAQARAAALLVVNASDTFTPGGFNGVPNPASNVLRATTGGHVLSPGGVILAPGPNPSLEDDGVTLIFDPPVKAFGFDHLSQSADGFSFTSITVRNPVNVTLFSGVVAISNFGGGGAPAGADFWGIVSTDFDIARVIIGEDDNDNQFPDCNIGFDTLRVHTPAPPCPADFNQDGGIDGADVDAFFVAWEGGQGSADVNADGGVDGADVDTFFASWEAGGCG